jgi:hypothetical protein
MTKTFTELEGRNHEELCRKVNNDEELDAVFDSKREISTRYSHKLCKWGPFNQFVI